MALPYRRHVHAAANASSLVSCCTAWLQADAVESDAHRMEQMGSASRAHALRSQMQEMRTQAAAHEAAAQAAGTAIHQLHGEAEDAQAHADMVREERTNWHRHRQ